MVEEVPNRNASQSKKYNANVVIRKLYICCERCPEACKHEATARKRRKKSSTSHQPNSTSQAEQKKENETLESCVQPTGKQIKARKGKILTCAICQVTVNDLVSYKQHMKRHEYKFPCPICKEKFSQAKSRRVHIKSTHTKFSQCNVCEMYYESAFLDFHECFKGGKI